MLWTNLFSRLHPAPRRPYGRATAIGFRPRLETLETRELLSTAGLGQLFAQPNIFTLPTNVVGLTPAQVRHAYGFDKTELFYPVTSGKAPLVPNGQGQTIAIVDAYDDPEIYGDLLAFDLVLGLPNPPQFTKATPEGTPASNTSWSVEMSLDVEWAHAIAPAANILLVEAKSSSLSDLIGAVDYARSQPGVVTVSMSWGSSEFAAKNYWYAPWNDTPGENSFDGHFTTPTGHVGGSGLPGGITFVASTGDNGAPGEWPAFSPNVVAVGGTTLDVDSSGDYLGETGWSHGGGGISSVEGKPSYQQNVTQSTGNRTIPDVAYDADPGTGFAVFDTNTQPGSPSGWMQVGGTSAGRPNGRRSLPWRIRREPMLAWALSMGDRRRCLCSMECRVLRFTTSPAASTAIPPDPDMTWSRVWEVRTPMGLSLVWGETRPGSNNWRPSAPPAPADLVTRFRLPRAPAIQHRLDLRPWTCSSNGGLPRIPR